MRRDTRQACVPHSLPCSHRKVTCTHIKKAAIYSSKRELSPETNQIGTLILNLQHWEKINFCYLSHRVYIWFWQHKLTSTKDECHSWVHERVDSGNRENVVLSSGRQHCWEPFSRVTHHRQFPQWGVWKVYRGLSQEPLRTDSKNRAESGGSRATWKKIVPISYRMRSQHVI